MTELQNLDILNRIPPFELSYETISHKKVSPAYNTCLAIPQGKKCFMWYTFLAEQDVCLLLFLNKDKIINKIIKTDNSVGNKLSLGTIIYGTFIENENENEKQTYFVVEEIFYYKGISLKNTSFQEKLDFLYSVMTSGVNENSSIKITLPVMWEINQSDNYDCPTSIPENINDIIGYLVHHIQYRCFSEIKPYLNVFLVRKLNLNANLQIETKKVKSTHEFETIPIQFDYSKPQYKYPTVFQVTADIQFDIYHLFAYGKNNVPVYYSIAGIPNYKTSVFMNSIFRKIKENVNLDYIEESDDEDEFQNIDEDRFVDINKVVLMECIFNIKFKKWIPLRILDNYSKMTHISKLTRDNDTDFNRNTQYANQRHNHHNINHHHNNNHHRFNHLRK